MNRIERLGRAPGRLNASASSMTPVVPEPSSSAPLLMLSRWPGVMPMWSMWAEKTTYSLLSFGSVPSRIPMVFGAVVLLSTESRRSTRTASDGTSRPTTSPASRMRSRSTPTARSAGATVISLTSTLGGTPEPRSRP